MAIILKPDKIYKPANPYGLYTCLKKYRQIYPYNIFCAIVRFVNEKFL